MTDYWKAAHSAEHSDWYLADYSAVQKADHSADHLVHRWDDYWVDPMALHSVD